MKAATVPIKQVFIDVDGTAVDTEPRNRQIIETLLQEAGYTLAPARWDELAGQDDHHIWSIIAKEFPELRNTYPTPESFQAAEDELRAKHPSQLMPHEEVKELVQKFNGLSSPVVAVSNSLKADVETSLREAGYDLSQFSFIIGKDTVRSFDLQPKPARDPYTLALTIASIKRGLTLSPTDCLAIEDSPTGVFSALAAGMNVVQITNENKPVGAGAVVQNSVEGRYPSLRHTELSGLDTMIKRDFLPR